MNLKHDKKLLIAVGGSRMTKHWQNKEVLWSELLDKLSTTTRTRETVAEYAAMSKDEKNRCKDVGGFVAGYLKNGKRNNASVVNRCALCLDADNADPALLDDLDMLFINAYAYYSTHSHTPEKMRLRLIIPLARTVTPDEYAAVARRVAADLTLTRFDPTTFEPARLMYWPSTPEDGEYLFHYEDAPFLDPDEVLHTYADWRDTSLWPTTKPLEERMHKAAEKAEDPLTKAGIVGAFCRAHSMTDVLETILSPFYTPTNMEDRFTYVNGTSSGGLVVYDDKFAFSHHATDPAAGRLCNAFDLVRLHLFTPGIETENGIRIDTEQKSFQMMREYAASDEATRSQLAQERMEEAERDFSGDPDEPDEDWQNGLDVDRQGNVKDTLGNLALILRKDPKLKDIAYNLHRSGLDIRYAQDETTTLPWQQVKRGGWTESDFGALQIYLERVYGLYAPTKLKGILLAVAAERAYHPIRDYIESLPPWDGVPRIEHIFRDYLGAKDTPYNSAVARKMMVAAVARIYQPGVKFDSVVVLVGPQGLGKSTFFTRLGVKWFTDSLTLGDMRDRTSAEKLQGNWILELGELAGLKKVDVETVKAFITRQDDKYRPSYGLNVEDHPRQCIIVGSTNKTEGFLQDITGNRRFWPVICEKGAAHKPWEVEEIVPQLWAEAYHYYRQGEPLYLDNELEESAKEEQVEALESDSRQGMIAEYLEKLLPEDWDRMDISERRAFLRGDMLTAGNRVGTVQRTAVCAMEIWAECFGSVPSAIKRNDTYQIFGMLEKIGGWEKYDGNVNGTIRRPPYGPQRCYIRTSAKRTG